MADDSFARVVADDESLRREEIPTIFITARGVIARVMADGSVGWLLEPANENSRLKAISQALSG